MYDDEAFFSTNEEAPQNVTRKLAVPLTLTLVGIGAISVAFLLASRPDVRKLEIAASEEEGYDVENYDVVKDKPLIYSICE
jgi:hypothetical protein